MLIGGSSETQQESVDSNESVKVSDRVKSSQKEKVKDADHAAAAAAERTPPNNDKLKSKRSSSSTSTSTKQTSSSSREAVVRYTQEETLIYPRRRTRKKSRYLPRKSRDPGRISVYQALDFRSWALAGFALLLLCHAWLWYCAFDVVRNESFAKVWWKPVVL